MAREVLCQKAPAAPRTAYMSSSRRAYVAWVIVCLVWGTTYLAMRVALETVPPFLMAGIRYTTAGSILAIVLRASGQRLPAPAAWPSLTLLGTLLLGFGNGGVAWAEQTVPSGLTAVLVAVSPFWLTGLDAFLPGGERLSPRRVAGLLVGFFGIVALVWPDLGISGGRSFLEGVAAAQIACIGWAVGSIYARRRGHGAAKDENVLATAAFEMIFGGAVLLAAGAVHGEFARLAFNPRTATALGYLSIFGAAIGFTAYAYALKHLSVATLSLYAYVNPVIAVLLGTIVLHEPFGMRMLAGGAMVLAGVAMVQRRSG